MLPTVFNANTALIRDVYTGKFLTFTDLFEVALDSNQDNTEMSKEQTNNVIDLLVNLQDHADFNGVVKVIIIKNIVEYIIILMKTNIKFTPESKHKIIQSLLIQLVQQ